jgi:hypothetical protein
MNIYSKEVFMRATTVLPQDYIEERTLTLSHNRNLMLGLTLGSAVLFVGFGILFLAAARYVAPSFHMSSSITLRGWGGVLLVVGIPAGAIVLTGFVHELIHGLFYWLLTRARPTYGFKIIYAYAAAPDFYIPRNQSLIVGLAPFVLISLGGLVLLLFTPFVVTVTLVFIMTINAAGCAGDFYIVGLLLTRPASTLTRDIGDSMTFYRPALKQNSVAIS